MTDSIAPTWYNAAKKDIGVKEVPGSGNNATIMGWAKRLGNKTLGMVYNADSVPWCGLAMSHWMEQRGFRSPPVPVRAKSWATWGTDLGREKFYQGSIVVFQRPGGGHVAFCAGHTDTHLKVLGGNQSDSVNYTWIEKSRCIAQRWPTGSKQIPQPALKFTSHTGPVSTNEA